MAILKHKTSKNAQYSDVLEYYTFKHHEDQITGHYEPILDENGLLQERDSYAVSYITAGGEEADPELWAAACMKTNLLFGKNRGESEIKNHEYILAHPEEDMISEAEVMEEAKAFAKAYLTGYDTLIAVHDKHAHITINSVRANARGAEAWMKKDAAGQILPCELAAGAKHQNSAALQHDMHEWLLEYTRSHGFVAKDNNAIAAARRAERHGSKNEIMKAALLEAAGRCSNMTELQKVLKDSYGMDLKVSGTGKTISVLCPGNEKYVRLRTLGMEPTDLTRRFNGKDYTYSEEEEAALNLQKAEEAEKRQYIEWLRLRRIRNEERGNKDYERAVQMAKDNIRKKGERYNKEDFGDLNFLIRETTRLEAALQTELDKMDRFIDRWDKAMDPTLPAAEREKHAGYVRWCGCDPEIPMEREAVDAARAAVIAEQQMAAEMREVLQKTADKWKGHNDLIYAERDFEWQKKREAAIKQQMKEVRGSALRLIGIGSRFEERVEKNGKQTDLEKAQMFNRMAFDRAMKLKELEKKLEQTKKDKKKAKEKLREKKKEYRNQKDAPEL